MDKIRAIVADPDAKERLVIREVDPPGLKSNQALIRVRAISLNRGEVMRAFRTTEITQPGWDFAGVVEQSAQDGSGPKQGTRVVGLAPSGAWAEVVAAPAKMLAVLPDAVSFQQAATLPVAGLTALLALEKGGLLIGRNVLVTGASGGVGDFAVRIAHQNGARVVGVVHHPDHQQSVLDAGADQVVISEDGSGAAQFGPYDLIADALGGRAFSTVLTQLAEGGVAVTYSSGLTGTDIAFSSRSVPHGATLYFLFIFQELQSKPAGVSLARLVDLIAEGRLCPRIGVEASWMEIAGVAQRLLNREFTGKAVLLID